MLDFLNKPTISPDWASRPTIASHRLEHALDEAVDVLTHLAQLPWPIDILTAKDLLAKCLQHQNERFGLSRSPVVRNELVANFGPAGFSACDYRTPLKSGPLYITSFSDGDRGRFLAFGLSFARPSWGEVANAFSGFRTPRCPHIRYLDLTGDAA